MRSLLAAFSLLFLLSACAEESKFRTYDGPEVTRIEVLKSKRRLFLLHDDEVLRSYRIQLGFTPTGHKQRQGDGRTPEGVYRIDRKNPRSQFYLSLGISYPDRRDVADAHARGVNPGGDIFIHGDPRTFWARFRRDWTFGCIAVSNSEIEEIYAMVDINTPIRIRP